MCTAPGSPHPQGRCLAALSPGVWLVFILGAQEVSLSRWSFLSDGGCVFATRDEPHGMIIHAQEVTRGALGISCK